MWSRVGHTAVIQVGGVALTGQIPKLLLSSSPQVEHTSFFGLLLCWGRLLDFIMSLDNNKPSNMYEIFLTICFVQKKKKKKKKEMTTVIIPFDIFGGLEFIPEDLIPTSKCILQDTKD